MGWWSADILGGDTPWDELGTIEKLLGWDPGPKYKRGFLTVVGVTEFEDEEERKLRDEIIIFVNKRENRKKLVDHILAYDPKEREVQILTVAFVMADFGLKFNKKVRAHVEKALPIDLKEWDDDPEREEAQKDLLRRMDIADGACAADSQWEVYLTRHRSGSLKVKVTAPTKRAAKVAAKKLAEGVKYEMYQDRYEVDEVLEVK